MNLPNRLNANFIKSIRNYIIIFDSDTKSIHYYRHSDQNNLEYSISIASDEIESQNESFRLGSVYIS